MKNASNVYSFHLKREENDINNGFIDAIESLKDTSANLWTEVEKAISNLDIDGQKKQSILGLIGLYPKLMSQCLDFWKQAEELRHQETLNSYSSLPTEAQKKLSMTLMRDFTLLNNL